MVDLQTCFSVPADTEINGKEQKLIVDQDYLDKMLKFHRRVNPKEDIIGFYMSGTEINSQVLAMFKMFQTIIGKQKNSTSLAGNPLLLLIDPTMQNNRLSIKILSIVTASIVPVFAECQFSFATKDYEKTGLDILFFG